MPLRLPWQRSDGYYQLTHPHLNPLPEGEETNKKLPPPLPTSNVLLLTSYFLHLPSNVSLLNPQRSLPDISMPFLIRQYLFHHKPACRVTQFIKEFDVRLVLSNCLILSIKIVLHHLHKVAAFFNLRRGSSRVTAQIINPLCNHLHMFHLITPDLHSTPGWRARQAGIYHT